MLDWRKSAEKTTALSYLIGVFLGDGCVTFYNDKKGRKYLTFKLNAIDKDFVQRTVDCINILYDANKEVKTFTDTHYRQGYYYNVSYQNQELGAFLYGQTLGKKIIPPMIYAMSDSDKKHFIAGCMDSEGYFAKATKKNCKSAFSLGIKCCDDWIHPFKYILESVGVKIKRKETCKPYKEWYRVPYRYILDIDSYFGNKCFFNIARKQDRYGLYKKA